MIRKRLISVLCAGIVTISTIYSSALFSHAEQSSVASADSSTAVKIAANEDNSISNSFIKNKSGKFINVEQIRKIELSNPIIVDDSKMWSGKKVTYDCIWFGLYPQTEVTESNKIYIILDNKTNWNNSNMLTINETKYIRILQAIYNVENNEYEDYYRYFKLEPIKWRVMESYDGELLLFSDKILDCKEYMSRDLTNNQGNYKDVDWDNCVIRSWLNGLGADSNLLGIDYSGKGFIDEAFSLDEKKMLENIENSGDKVSLFTANDLLTESYGFSPKWFLDTWGKTQPDQARCANPSDYALAMGVGHYGREYWLKTNRNLGTDYWGIYVGPYANYWSGGLYNNGCNVDWGLGVRPIIKIKIDSPNLLEYAGTVCTDGTNNYVSELSLQETLVIGISNLSTIKGQLKLNKNIKAYSDILSSEVSGIKWTSSDQSIVPDSSISCAGVNSYDNRSAELMISFTPQKEGKVTITGTTSNGLTASCDVTIGGCIAINQKANDLEGCTIALSGMLTLEESTEASEANLQAAIDSLKFESSDESKAKVLACNVVQSQDHRSATLEIWTTLYNKGTTTITATVADGHTSKCEITIAEDTSENNTNYEGDYTSEMREFLLNKGTHNTLKYLCNDANFTASTFVAEKDAAVGNLLVMALTDVYYRGWDGWKDLIDGSTSIEEAEKIIASLLGAYQAKVEDLSKAKTAQKYAEMINNAFSDYSNASNLFKSMHSDEIEVVRKYFSESNIARLLYEGKYSEIAAPVNQILQDGKINQILQNGTQSEVFQQGSEAAKSWNKMMEGFTQSAEVSKVLKVGCQTKLGRLEIGGGLNGIGKALEVVSFAQDTINYLYQLESLLTADEMYCEMLLYIQKNCAYSVVQEAAGNLYSIINDGVEGIISDVVIKAANLGGKKVLNTALDIASKSCLPFTIVKAGFDWGVDLSNTFFKTGSTQELKDSLRSQAFLANCLGKWVVSNEIDYLSAIDTDNEMEKGKELYYSLYMLWESRKNAEETLQSLLKTTGADWSANYGVSTRITSSLEAYQNNIFKDETMENLLQISVSCPVDVEVYDKNGLKLLTVKDGAECQGYEKGIYYYCVYNPLADDYDKYIYYSEDADYNVKIIGNDLGLADCSVSRADDEGYISEFYCENMEIDNGTVINLDSISKEGVNYKITDLNGNETSNAMEHRKADKIATLSMSLNTDLLELEVGEKQLLTVSFAPVNAANQKVVWDSSDDSVVSVNNDGVITAITAGTAVITVSQGDLKQTCKITVKEQSGKIIFGDMNSDGEVNSKDAVLLKKHLAGYTGLNIDIIAADVNMDGGVDSKDAVRLLRHLAGYEVKLGE